MNDVKSIEVIYKDVQALDGTTRREYVSKTFDPPINAEHFNQLMRNAFDVGCFVIIDDSTSLLIPTANIISMDLNHEE